MRTTSDLVQAVVGDSCFPALRDYVISSTGLTFYEERPDALAGHIADRLKTRGIGSCRGYLDLLQDARPGGAELDRLIELLTIGETYFFRHREMFDALRDIALPEILARNQSTQRLRIWSAGCSIGAEAYSVSILLRRELRHLLRGWDVSILGTDINRQFLAQAAQARYEDWAFRGTSPELRQECFERDGNAWRIDPRFKEGVAFQYHNLARDPFPSTAHNLLDFDLIMCRNVLIYFDRHIVQNFIYQMEGCLAPGGWLGMGHAEYCHQFDSHLETVIFPGASLYRRSLSPRIHDTVDLNATLAAQPAAISLKPAETSRENRRRAAHASAVAVVQSTPRPCSAATLPPLGQTSQAARLQELADQGGVDEALELCETLVANDRLNPAYHYFQALLLDQADQQDAAIHALQKAIYLDRGFVLAHYYLGLMQQKSKCTRGA
jgi:chemotaxis protein methyltransferase CheR